MRMELIECSLRVLVLVQVRFSCSDFFGSLLVFFVFVITVRALLLYELSLCNPVGNPSSLRLARPGSFLSRWPGVAIHPFRTAVSFWGQLGTIYLEFEWIAPKTGLEF